MGVAKINFMKIRNFTFSARNLSLLGMAIILGSACSTAPKMKVAEKKSSEQVKAEHARIAAEVDRYLAWIGTPVSKELVEKLGEVLGRSLTPVAKQEATEAILAYVQNTYRIQMRMAIEDIANLPENEVKAIIEEIVTHPGLFKLNPEAVGSVFDNELKGYANTQKGVTDEATKHHLPFPISMTDLQEVEHNLLMNTMAAKNVPLAERKRLGLELMTVEREFYHDSGMLLWTKNTCSLAQNMSVEGEENIIKLGKRTLDKYREANGDMRCFEGQKYAEAFDGWFREDLSGVAATSGELVEKEADRMIALYEQCGLTLDRGQIVARQMKATREMPKSAYCGY